MRTTITLDEDVARRAKDLTSRLGRPFKQVINEALRAGLEQVETPAGTKPFRTKARKMGLRQGLSLDNIQELLAYAEGEDAR